MTDDLENTFGDLAYRAVEKAERVDCSLEQFRTGLMIMIGVIRERIDQVKNELDANGKREDLDE